LLSSAIAAFYAWRVRKPRPAFTLSRRRLGGLFGIFNRGVFPDFAYWTKSSEVLIMTLLGGMGTFYGPAVGALALLWLNQQIVSYTEYWPFILGLMLVILLFAFPGGIVGTLELAWSRAVRRLARA
jgi:branched-chain amino acid transport system permease protein